MKRLFKFIPPWFLPAFLAALFLSACPQPEGENTAPEPPAAPGTLAVTTGDEELRVSWAAVTGAAAYDVYYTADGDPSLAVTVSTPEAVVWGLANTVSYSVWVKAKNAAGSSGFSPPGTGTPVAQEYTIDYNTNGGSGTPPGSDSKWSSDAITIPGQGSLIPPGADYVFLGWNTQANGGGWGYMPSESYTRKASVTFYARWVQYNDMANVPGGTVTGSDGYAFNVTIPNDPAYNNPGAASERKGVFVEGRTVPIDSFDMAKYETTQDLWITVQNWALEHGYQFQNKKNTAPSEANKTKPVTGVSWRDAVVWCNAYSEMNGKDPVYTYGGTVIKDSRNAAACNGAIMDKTKNGYRLPTEAEREFAARGGDPGQPDWMFTYSGSNIADNVAWHHGNSPYQTQLVGSKAANRLGIHDLSGNVQEWCWDWMNYAVDVTAGTTLDGADYNPVSANQKAFNGGGTGSNVTMSCVAYRWGYSPDYTDNYVGFRVVCTP
jgi:formylglycine-generating enzyme required for sulfatase activity